MSLKADWIAPRRTALLLVDMQVDFALPEGALGKAGFDMTAPQAAVRQAEKLAAAARDAGVPCVFVRLIAADESGFLRDWKTRRGDAAPMLCREGTPGADFAGPRPQGGELVFSKKRYDAFTGTGLDAALKGEGIDTLVAAGLTSECCIAATAQGAFERDYHVFVAADATACYTPDLQAAALAVLALTCATLTSTAEVRAAWKM